MRRTFLSAAAMAALLTSTGLLAQNDMEMNGVGMRPDRLEQNNRAAVSAHGKPQNVSGTAHRNSAHAVAPGTPRRANAPGATRVTDDGTHTPANQASPRP